MKNLKNILMSLAAVLLVATPPADAARWKSKRRAAKAVSAPQAQKLVSEGLKALESQNYDSAIQDFASATKADHKDSSAFFLLGYAHYQRGFRNGNPEKADKGDAMETISAYSAALALDPKLKTVSAPYRLYHSLALSYEALNENEKAIENYKKAFEMAPNNPMLPLYAARLRHKLNDVSKAASNLNLSLKKAKEQNKEKAIVGLLKSDPYFSPLLNSSALQKVAQVYDPTLIAKVDLNEEMGEMRDAVRDTLPDQRAKMVTERVQNPEILGKLGAADADFNYRHFSQAIDGYNAAIRLNQKTGTLNSTQMSLIYEKMGIAYRKLGQSEGAIKALQYSVQEMPFNHTAHYELALVYSVEGKFSQSLRALSEALKTAPSEGERRKTLLLAKTDSELDPVRDMPGFRGVLRPFTERL